MEEVQAVVDFRCHVAGIIGVFLALGLGMLIGTQLSEDGTLLEEQIRLVERIEDGLNRMRAENRRLSEELAVLEERLQTEQRFVHGAIAARVTDRLPAKGVTVYAASDQEFAVRRVLSVLELAGAQVTLHRRARPPAPDELEPPYVIVWADLWGEPGDLPGRLPAGGVVAAASGWSSAGASAASDGASVVEYVATPDGLLSLVQRLGADDASTAVVGGRSGESSAP